MKQSVNIPNAPAPIGPYSPAIIAGNQLFVSGQIPLDPLNGTFKNETIEEATEQVMENLKNIIIAAGFTMNDVVKCSIFLKDLNNFSAVNQVYSRYFGETPPARETVEISRLPMDAIVEISCIAIKA
ncbi:MAG: RidA family protein [Flavobacteriales bacterium]|jgi:2-iminobutanoate/2-iminopropanoate deaminase